MLVIDTLSVPSIEPSDNELDVWIRGGVSAMVVTVAARHSAREALGRIARWYDEVADSGRLTVAERASDITSAAQAGKVALVLQFQDTRPVEYDLGLLSIYRRLGVMAIQLAYNQRNLVGDGCEEEADAGLSKYGRDVVAEMNRLGIIVDLSHTGRQTTLDALTRSTRPCIFSHSNARAVHDHPRNIDDDQIRALAAGGGLIGVCGIPAFLTADPNPTMDHLIDHIDHIVQLVGDDHVAIGTDYGTTTTAAERDQLVKIGAWRAANYPPLPWNYPTDFEDASKFPNLTARLAERGYSPASVEKILGMNFLRVFGEVCGA